MLMNVLASVRPPKTTLDFEEADIEAVSQVCPALADLAHAENTPFTTSIKTSLMLIHQAFSATSNEHVMAGITTQVLEEAESNLKEGRIDKLLADLPSLQTLMKERNSWAAGTAIAFASAHLVVTSLAGSQADKEEQEAAKDDEQTDDAAAPTKSPSVNRQRGLDELLSFFATLEQTGVPLENISLRPLVTNSKGSLAVTGRLEAPVPFSLLAKLNAAVKKAWPSSPDLKFSGNSDSTDIAFTYFIEQ
jgi:hypothetical protein